MDQVLKAISRLGGKPVGEMMIPPPSGAYALLLHVKRDLKLKTGVLGRVVLPAGRHIYAGRAGRGLPARLARHRRREKPVVWHVDHLTRRREVVIEAVWVIAQKPDMECEIVRAGLSCPGTRILIPRFGAGDCREKCPAHLFSLAPLADSSD